ncbi:DNA damage-inducible transcript 4 protein [Bagarius yarrelli]|uniref:DNA damage-inducible transcript 4 protein n=1 Tax=Bagarius yarrelli TaxID=175774 RepID=A0A556TN08_BAGYA|nr:DNA damage-inducible transcript 4 protein [Bagarius yarrelli]
MDYSQSESGVSKRLSWGKVVEKLLHHTDDTKSTGKRDSGCLSTLSMDDDPFEEALCEETVTNMSDLLNESSAELLGSSRLVLPHVLLERIRQELLHLAATEPCGLRGAIVDVCVDNSKTHQSLGQISVDPDIVPTFHLTFLLRLDVGGLWPKFTSRLSNSVKMSTGFTVVKRKLYSSEEVYVEEL